MRGLFRILIDRGLGLDYAVLVFLVASAGHFLTKLLQCPSPGNDTTIHHGSPATRRNLIELTRLNRLHSLPQSLTRQSNHPRLNMVLTAKYPYLFKSTSMLENDIKEIYLQIVYWICPVHYPFLSPYYVVSRG